MHSPFFAQRVTPTGDSRGFIRSAVFFHAEQPDQASSLNYLKCQQPNRDDHHSDIFVAKRPRRHRPLDIVRSLTRTHSVMVGSNCPWIRPDMRFERKDQNSTFFLCIIFLAKTCEFVKFTTSDNVELQANFGTRTMFDQSLQRKRVYRPDKTLLMPSTFIVGTEFEGANLYCQRHNSSG